MMMANVDGWFWVLQAGSLLMGGLKLVFLVLGILCCIKYLTGGRKAPPQ